MCVCVCGEGVLLQGLCGGARVAVVYHLRLLFQVQGLGLTPVARISVRGELIKGWSVS